MLKIVDDRKSPKTVNYGGLGDRDLFKISEDSPIYMKLIQDCGRVCTRFVSEIHQPTYSRSYAVPIANCNTIDYECFIQCEGWTKVIPVYAELHIVDKEEE